jgi:hypothetical protein
MFNKFIERNKIKNKDKQLNKLTKELIDLTLEYNNIEMTHSLPTNINISKFIQSNIFLDEQITHI